MVGFGRNDWEGHDKDKAQPIKSGGQGAGIASIGDSMPQQRSCKNTIESIDFDKTKDTFGLVHFKAPNRSTEVCLPTFGDSGGPMLYTDPADKKTYIYGFASTVFYPATGQVDAAYIAVVAQDAYTLIEKAVDWEFENIKNGGP